MPRSPRILAYLISATAVSAGLALAITPAALADDENQPHSPNDGKTKCDEFLHHGPEGAGAIAACPLIDPKFNFSPPTDRAAVPPAPGAPGAKASNQKSSRSQSSESDEGHEASRAARHLRHEQRNERNRAAAEDD